MYLACNWNWKNGWIVLLLCSISANLLPAQSKLQQLLDIAASETKPHFVNHPPKADDFPDFQLDCPMGTREMLHMADLDMDGDQDLIFNGTCAPYNHVSVFLNHKGSFELIWQSAGFVTQIEENAKGSSIWVWNEACCCAYYNSVIVLNIHQFQAIPKVETLYFHQNLAFPKDLVFEATTAKGNFRSSPNIDNTPIADACYDETIVGNVVFVKEEQTPAIRLAQTKKMQLLAVNTKGISWDLGWTENERKH